jgi:hypothetical protein
MDSEWNHYKGVLRTLYFSSNQEIATLRSIMAHMETRHNFIRRYALKITTYGCFIFDRSLIHLQQRTIQAPIQGMGFPEKQKRRRMEDHSRQSRVKAEAGKEECRLQVWPDCKGGKAQQREAPRFSQGRRAVRVWLVHTHNKCLQNVR